MTPQKRTEIINALRRGAVPSTGLHALAVGLGRFEEAIDDHLEQVATGHGVFKAIRGEYGTGKTFFVRWVEERARRNSFVTTEVQVSESETRLHKMQSVYRAAMDRIQSANTAPGSLADLIDRWFFQLEEDALEANNIDPSDEEAVEDAVSDLLEKRLAKITQTSPQLAAALRAYRNALAEDDRPTAQALLAWLAGKPHVTHTVKKRANIKGEIDHNAALNLLRGLLIMLRNSGFEGLVLVLDEVETLQRVRSDVREKSLNALRQLIDYIDEGQFPGLFAIITGTPAFYEGPQGVQRLTPLAQRLHTDFSTSAKFDNPRAVQIRLQGLQQDQLVELGEKIRDIYAAGSDHEPRILDKADDDYIELLANRVAGEFGGEIRIAPRLFLKKLVADILDRVDQFPEFDPRQDYDLTLEAEEMTEEEREIAGVDDITLDVE
mgnify:CR=1 FL=1